MEFQNSFQNNLIQLHYLRILMKSLERVNTLNVYIYTLYIYVYILNQSSLRNCTKTMLLLISADCFGQISPQFHICTKKNIITSQHICLTHAYFNK